MNLRVFNKPTLTWKVLQTGDVVDEKGPYIRTEMNTFQSPIHQSHKSIAMWIDIISINGFHDD